MTKVRKGRRPAFKVYTVYLSNGELFGDYTLDKWLIEDVFPGAKIKGSKLYLI